MRKNLTIFIFLAFLFESAVAQDISFNPGVDLMSRYVWRGLNPGGSSPSIQPSLEFTAGKFTLGTWGAFSTSNSLTIQETDLYVTYNFCDAFSMTITDYFLPDESAVNNHYFEFEEDSTGHLVELCASFNGTEKIPFIFMAAVNLWGADARHVNHKKQYSTYMELGYEGTVKNTEYRAFIGGTATSPKEEDGETGFYANSAGITNIGITATKTIAVTEKFSLPVSTSFIVNPKTEKVFLVLGISF